MRQSDYERQTLRRIARAEAECHATVLRAFDRLMRVLERERTNAVVRATRKRLGVQR